MRNVFDLFHLGVAGPVAIQFFDDSACRFRFRCCLYALGPENRRRPWAAIALGARVLARRDAGGPTKVRGGPRKVRFACSPRKSRELHQPGSRTPGAGLNIDPGDSVLVGPDFLVQCQGFVEVFARHGQIAFQPTVVAEQGLPHHPLEFLMRRRNRGRTAVNDFDWQLTRRRYPRLDPFCVLPSQKIPLYKGVYVVPGKLNERAALPGGLFDGKLLHVWLGRHALGPKRLHPFLEVKVLSPAVKPAPHPPRLLYNRTEPAITSRDYSFQQRSPRVMHFDFDPVTPAKLPQDSLLSLDGLDILLPAPLERGVRLGYKVRGGAGHLYRLVELVPTKLPDLSPQLGDPGNILISLGGKPYHEVHLDRRPSLRECYRARIHHVFLGHILVYDIAHALRAGLGRDRETGLADPGNLARQRLRNSGGSERRNGEADVPFFQLVPELLYQWFEASIV